MSRQSAKSATSKSTTAKSAFSKIRKTVTEFWDEAFQTTVTQAILEDHEGLKKLAKILKDEDESAANKKTAYVKFKSLLSSHSTSEEKAVYSLSEHLKDLKRKTNEGFVEHDVANSLVKKIKAPTSAASLEHWIAQVQVLAELVLHHLEEEEEDLLPQLKKKLSREEQIQAAKVFLSLRSKTQKLRKADNIGALEGKY